MKYILAWKETLPVIKRHYPKRGDDHQPIGLESMLRIYFMQQRYRLSEPVVE
ncbi:MAG: hypothetical protein AAF402_08220 [Pseudomonadota bacterium]